MSKSQKEPAKDDPKGGGGVRVLPGDGGGGGGSGASADPVAAPAMVEAATSAKLAARIGELERRLAEAQREVNASALQRSIDAALSGSGVIDVEVGRLLVEQALASAPDMGVEDAVGAVRRSKPFLFASASGGFTGAALAMDAGSADPVGGLASLAEEASVSGDRADLLRYLRARRGA